MAERFASISDDLAQWWAEQPLFFVATAPTGSDGHVNLSPKGLDTLRILGPTRVAYLDLTGSGVETIAHLRENGRITLMACAFSGAPRISRIYGTGTVHEIGSPAFAELASDFPDLPGARAVIEVAVDRVSTSCGYAVPLMELVGDRDRLLDWARAKGDDGLVEYRVSKNASSIDGLPGLGGPPRDAPRSRRPGPGAHGRARGRRAAALGRPRPAVPHRLRGDAARAAHDAGAPARRATRSLVVPRLEAPRVAPRPDLFEIVPWDETDDPVGRRGAVGRPAFGARGDRRPHVGALRARPPTGASARDLRARVASARRRSGW